MSTIQYVCLSLPIYLSILNLSIPFLNLSLRLVYLRIVSLLRRSGHVGVLGFVFFHRLHALTSQEIDSLKARVISQQCRVEVLTSSSSSSASLSSSSLSTTRRQLIAAERSLPSFSSSSMLHAVEQEDKKAKTSRKSRGIVAIGRPPSSQQHVFELEEGDYHQKSVANGSYDPSNNNNNGNSLTALYGGEEEERKRKRNLPSRFVRGLLAVADGMAHAASHTAKSVMWEGIGGRKRGGKARRESTRRSKKNKNRTKKRSERTTSSHHKNGLMFISSRVMAARSEKDDLDGEKLRVIEEGSTMLATTSSYDQEACAFGSPGEDEDDEELSSSSSSPSSSSSSSTEEEDDELPPNELALHGGELQPVSRSGRGLLSSASSSVACDSSLSSRLSPCRESSSPYLVDDLYGPPPALS